MLLIMRRKKEKKAGKNNNKKKKPRATTTNRDTDTVTDTGHEQRETTSEDVDESDKGTVRNRNPAERDRPPSILL